MSCIFALFTPCTWCGGGCGERYWGDFYSDPPECSDPCDCHGNYTGGTRGYITGGDYSAAPRSGGCRHCNGGGAQYGGTYDEGEVVDNAVEQSTVAPARRPTSGQPHKAVRPQQQ